jgi:hypothetical protein
LDLVELHFFFAAVVNRTANENTYIIFQPPTLSGLEAFLCL